MVKVQAMRTGFNKFIARNKDALVMLDADGTYDPAEIPILLSILIRMMWLSGIDYMAQ